MTNAFSGGISLKRGDGATPTEGFTKIAEVTSLSGLGQTNSINDVTNFDSNNAREYIAGLADGDEITIGANYIMGDAEQDGLVDDVKNRTNRNLQFEMTNGTITHTFDFTVTPISWKVGPVIDGGHTIDFTAKISGAITRTDS